MDGLLVGRAFVAASPALPWDVVSRVVASLGSVVIQRLVRLGDGLERKVAAALEPRKQIKPKPRAKGPRAKGES